MKAGSFYAIGDQGCGVCVWMEELRVNVEAKLYLTRKFHHCALAAVC